MSGARGGGGPEPERLAARIRDEAARAGIPAPGPALADRLGELLARLYRWNARINLTAIRDPDEGVRRHVVESLFALGRIPPDARGTLCDLGSGNGFPALPLLLAREGLEGVLFERVARKVDFLRAAIGGLGLAGRVTVREENLSSPENLPPDCRWVTLRAFPDPEGWIADIVRHRPEVTVLAWLDAEAARAVSSACRHSGKMAESLPLPTRPGGVLLVVR